MGNSYRHNQTNKRLQKMRLKKEEKSKFYVTMTDKFLSGWGNAQNKKNKFVVECDSMEQAEKIYHSAERRSEMSHVSIALKKPNYNAEHYFVSFTTYDELGEIWKSGK